MNNNSAIHVSIPSSTGTSGGNRPEPPSSLLTTTASSTAKQELQSNVSFLTDTSAAEQLTPPISPEEKKRQRHVAARLEANSLKREHSSPPLKTNDQHLLVCSIYPSPKSSPLAKLPPAPPCCERHLSINSRPALSEGSVIREECVGSVTCSRRMSIDLSAVGMTGREFELRTELASIQRLFRSEKKEVNKLKRKCTIEKKRRAAKLRNQQQRTTTTPAKQQHEQSPLCASKEPKEVAPIKQPISLANIGATGSDEEVKASTVHNGTQVEAVKTNGELIEEESPPLILTIKKEQRVDAAAKTWTTSTSDKLQPRTGSFGTGGAPVVADLISDNEVSDGRTHSSSTKRRHSDDLRISKRSTTVSTLSSNSGSFRKGTSSQTNGVGGQHQPRLCESDLVDGMRLIVLDGGLFYTGILKIYDNEGLLYDVQIDGQRGDFPNIFCQEQVLKTTFREVTVSKRQRLSIGDRVCAHWSGIGLQALYSGTVTALHPETNAVSINFDDGDKGIKKLESIRLLPKDFPLTKMITPVLPEFITRRRTSRQQGDSNATQQAHRAPKTHNNSTKTTECTTITQPPPSQSSTTNGNCMTSPKADVTSSEWHWVGNAQPDKKKRRVSYHAIRKNGCSIEIKVGDVVYLLDPASARRGSCISPSSSPSSSGNSSPSVGRSPNHQQSPYVATVEELWETVRGGKRVRVSWCYNWSEVHDGRATISAQKTRLTALLGSQLAKRALFRSTHSDDNSVDSISSKCSLVDYPSFCAQREAAREGDFGNGGGRLYFEAGLYDPVKQRITWNQQFLHVIDNTSTE